MADIIKPEDRADYKSLAYREMSVFWAKTQALYDGADATKRQGFLKQMEADSKAGRKAYENRKDEAELYGIFKSQIQSVVGEVFNGDIVPTNPPALLAPFFKDADLCGNDFQSVLREAFVGAVRDGLSYVYVDAPKAVESESGNTSLRDVQDRRPYLIHYEASQLVNWATEIVNGVVVLTRATLREMSIEPYGKFGEKRVERYKVLEKTSEGVVYSVWRVDNETEGKPLILEDDAISIGLDEIPLVPVYGFKKAPFVTIPPFMSVAEANLKHFNKLSMLDYILTFIKPKIVTKFDTLDDAKQFDISTMAVDAGIKIYGENADVKYLELKGDSIPELRIEIENVEKRISTLTMAKFAPIQDGSIKTATEVVTGKKEEMSEVAVMAQNLENAGDTIIDFVIAQFKNIRSEATVNVKRNEDLAFKIDYDRLTFSLDQMRYISEQVDSGRLSNTTFYEMLGRFLDMPKDWKPEDEPARIAQDRGQDFQTQVAELEI